MFRNTNVHMKTGPKMAAATLTVRVPTKLRKRLEGLARMTARNRSRLAVEALESYVDEQEEQLARIDQGIHDADAGRVVSHEKVKRYLQSWGSKRKLLPPRCK
jgi:predicted transcriptional regulator